MEKVSRKAIIYILLNQDKTFDEYIQPNWPDLQVLCSFQQFWCIAYNTSQNIPEGPRRYFEGPRTEGRGQRAEDRVQLTTHDLTTHDSTTHDLTPHGPWKTVARVEPASHTDCSLPTLSAASVQGGPGRL